LCSNSAKAHRNTYLFGCWNLSDCQRGHKPEDQVTQKTPKIKKNPKPTTTERKKERNSTQPSSKITTQSAP